ncbi:MAG: hypothetical protein K1X57_22045, partial [Gemmataceae bacterium]|nr:hypothetical protein [Gemmataceae bacterium]
MTDGFARRELGPVRFAELRIDGPALAVAAIDGLLGRKALLREIGRGGSEGHGFGLTAGDRRGIATDAGEDEIGTLFV